MKEDFLHYLWKYKKFHTKDLQTTDLTPITIIHSGYYWQSAGPDFFNAKLVIANQKWAGNVEIHLKSSDWYLHRHELDKAYDNVILHVVWEHDIAIYRRDGSEIPTLQLKNFVSEQTVLNYEQLTKLKSWIFCESQISQIDPFVIIHWQERLFFERLENKAALVQSVLTQTNNDWEATLFCLLARSFGSNTNGDLFYEMSLSLPYTIIRKESENVEDLEALMLGMCGLLNEPKQDVYFKTLLTKFEYLKVKHRLIPSVGGSAQFFQLRPDNFPTIRLSQLANLVASNHHLFSTIVNANSLQQIRDVFQVAAATYWQTHYQFDNPSRLRKKNLSPAFIDLLLINTIIPIRFAYAKSRAINSLQDEVMLLEEIKPEQNSIVSKFQSFGLSIENAFQTQALLQLKKEYCDKSRCLNCAIGVELLKSTK